MFAPFDGVISNRLLDPGAYASRRSRCFNFAHRHRLDQHQRSRRRSRLRSSRHAVRFSHVVAWEVVRRPHPNGQRRADVRNALVPGAHAAAQSRRRLARRNADQRDVPKQQASDAIVVPRSAVAQTETANIVYVVNGRQGSGRSGEGRRADRHARASDQSESSARNEGHHDASRRAQRRQRRCRQRRRAGTQPRAPGGNKA